MEDFVSAPWLRRLIAAVVLAGLVVLGFRVLEPFIVPLVWACILAFVSWPAHARLLRLCRGRSTVASLLTTTAVSLAVIAPLAWLAVVLRIELIRAYHETQALLAGGLQLPPAVLKLPWLGEQLRDLTARAAQDPHALGAELRKLTDHSFEEITHIVGEISRNVAKLLLTVVSLFFVFRDGERVAGELARALEQLLGPRVHNYLRAIGQTVKAVVYGLVLAALVQGALAGLGYWIAGATAPVFLAALTTVFGLIPFAAPSLWRRRRVARDQRQPCGGRGAAHLGGNRRRLDRPPRAAFPHHPRGADSLPGGDVRRAGRARGVRTRGPLRGSGDSRGAARDLARVAAAEQPAGRAGLSARYRARVTARRRRSGGARGEGPRLRRRGT